MTKDVFLTLKSIKYSGDSIGNDIRIETDAIGQPFGENYEINRGKTRKLDEPVGKFPVDQSTFSLPITVRMIERDIRHNDVGVTEKKLKIDLNELSIQKEKIVVEVRELGWPGRGKKAIFEVGFDIQVMEVMHYIKELEKGFIDVILDGYPKDKARQSLPAFLKVRLDKHEDRRDHFTVMEGWRHGETGSVTLDKNGKSFLIPGNPHTRPARMQYSRFGNRLIVNGKSYVTVENTGEPWENGLYDIEIAGYAHDLGEQYVNEAPKAKVWFHVGHGRSERNEDKRFIHTGRVSLGCVTIKPEKWHEVYDVLIKARLGDSKSVGILEVID